MSTAYEIPLSATPQAFSINLADKAYNLEVKYCHVVDTWVVDISDTDELPVLLGLPLVTGVDLLGLHKHLGIGGMLVVQSDGEVGRVPTFNDLGTNGHLYFVVE